MASPVQNGGAYGHGTTESGVGVESGAARTAGSFGQVLPGFSVPGVGRAGPFRAPAVARDGKDETNGSNGGGWMYNLWRPGSQNGNPGSLVLYQDSQGPQMFLSSDLQPLPKIRA